MAPETFQFEADDFDLLASMASEEPFATLAKLRCVQCIGVFGRWLSWLKFATDAAPSIWLCHDEPK